MGNHSNGYIFFGVVFPYGYKLPWGYNEEKYKGHLIQEVRDFWIFVEKGFVYPNSSWYDKSGILKGEIQTNIDEENTTGWDSAEIDKNVFYRDNPCPYETQYHGYDATTLLFLDKTQISCGDDYPTAFVPEKIVLEIYDEDIENLINFCQKHDLKYEQGPDWFLSCSYG